MFDNRNGSRLSLAERKAWGDYLRAFEWHHFATFTLRTAWLESMIPAEFAKTADRLATIALGGIRWFYAIEEGIAQVNIHSLIWGSQNIPVRVIEAAWSLGNARVRVYDPIRNAAWYVAKDLRADAYDLYLTDGKPPSRNEP